MPRRNNTWQEGIEDHVNSKYSTALGYGAILKSEEAAISGSAMKWSEKHLSQSDVGSHNKG